MPREDARMRGRRLASESRLRVLAASDDDATFVGEVRGDHGVYIVSHDPDQGWACDCATRRGECSHVAAAQLVFVTRPREQS